jgi:hypothetical protein
MALAPFTVFVEYARGGDQYAVKVQLPENPSDWTETMILDSVTEEGEDRLMVWIAAVIPGHVESLWGGVINA